MSDGSTDRSERTVWQPNHADSGLGTVRAIGPTQDAMAAAIHAELVDIGEKSLDDRATAERIVSGLFRDNGQLVAAASHTIASTQREAAKRELVRMMRRATLDSLPPVVASQPMTESATAKAPGPARKLRPVAKVATTTPSKPAPRPARHGILLLLLTLAAIAGGAYLLSRALWPPSDELADPPPPEAAATAPALAETVPPAVLSGTPEDALDPPTDLLKLQAEEPALGRFGASIGETRSTTAQDGTPQLGDAVPAAIGGELRVFILYPDAAGAAAVAGEMYATLSDSGEFPLVVLRDVDFTIATPRIRYFYPEDGGAADALADVLQPPSDDGSQWTVQDFTRFRPLPAPGTLEIFIPAL